MLRRTVWALSTLAWGALLPWAVAAPDAPVPEARQVVVRGRTDLADAIQAAFGGGETPACVGLVLDVTPHTRRARPALRAALRRLEGRRDLPPRWRIAPLGGRFSPAVDSPARLASVVGPLLARDTNAADTVAALQDTVKTFADPSGAIVYLADWRFEDEHDVEDLIGRLLGMQLRFGVVGSEAGFGRGWNDGVLETRQRMTRRPRGGGLSEAYDPAIGRRPYGPFDRQAPWHGGDTAAPHVPYRFAGDLWDTEFTPGNLAFGEGAAVLDPTRLRGGDLEDLLERRGRGAAAGDAAFRRFPLPSAFGPHGLMRAAARCGGRYVLWSWNPEHRVSIRYDHARCDRFGPDLRSRSEIRRTQAANPAALAMLRAWDHLTQRRTAVVAHTAPLDRQGRGPRSIDLVDREHTQLPLAWPERSMHRAFLEQARAWKQALAEARAMLERGIERAGASPAGPAARLRADAVLLRHIVDVLHFELAEAILVAKDVPASAWKDDENFPGLRAVTWIERGDDPEKIRTTRAVAQDAEAGSKLLAARAAHLRRYRGTPFGLQVAANPVDTWVVRRLRRMKPSTSPFPGRAPAESGGETPRPTTPKTGGGSSSGGGPTTGK